MTRFSDANLILGMLGLGRGWGGWGAAGAGAGPGVNLVLGLGLGLGLGGAGAGAGAGAGFLGSGLGWERAGVLRLEPDFLKWGSFATGN